MATTVSIKQNLPHCKYAKSDISEAYNEIVTIIVGKHTTKTYSVHKGVLVFYSGYFAKALEGRFREAKDKEVKLPDAEPEVFDLVQNWLYSHSIYHHNVIEAGKRMQMAPKIWFFADAHDIPALQNAATDFIHSTTLSKWVVPVESLPYIYENTMVSAHLRKFAIEVIAHTCTATNLLTPDLIKYFVQEAACDILKIVCSTNHKQKGKEDVRKWNLCKYHVHEDGVRCEK